MAEEHEQHSEPDKKEANTLLHIRTEFSREKVLEDIGIHLQKENLITGFRIRTIRSGYKYNGKHHVKTQYELNILTPITIDADAKAKIYDYIEEIIGKDWDVPMIEEKPTTVNNAMRLFVEGKESSDSALRRIRRNLRRATFGLMTLATLGGSIGGTSLWMEHRGKEAVKQEREKIYRQISVLERQMEEATRELNAKLVLGQPLTFEESEFGTSTVKEVNDLRDKVRALKFSVEKLKDRE